MDELIHNSLVWQLTRSSQQDWSYLHIKQKFLDHNWNLKMTVKLTRIRFALKILVIIMRWWHWCALQRGGREGHMRLWCDWWVILSANIVIAPSWENKLISALQQKARSWSLARLTDCCFIPLCLAQHLNIKIMSRLSVCRHSIQIGLSWSGDRDNYCERL